MVEWSITPRCKRGGLRPTGVQIPLGAQNIVKKPPL